MKPRLPVALFSLLGLLALAGIACQAATALLTGAIPTTPPANQTLAPPPASPLPSATTLPGPPESGLRLVGYYTAWNVKTRGYPIRQVPAGKLTHLIYAFAVITEGTCAHDDLSADEANFSELRQLRQAYPHLKTLVSIGGSGQSEGFSQAAQDEESRRVLAASCVQFMLENGFDGLDIDWEFPQPEESHSFTALMAELRRQLDVQAASDGRGHYLLTFAAGASPYQYEDIDPGQVVPYLDWISLMTYNYHGRWSALTGFNAPLYPAPGDLATSQVERLTFNVDAAVQAFLSAGVPPEKILVGAPFFGRCWSGVPDQNHGLYQSFSNTEESGRSYDYRELAEAYLVEGSGYSGYRDEAARVPWLYNPDTQVMISYDDPQSLEGKAAYVREKGLGGMMAWQLGMDDRQGSLLNALYNSLFVEAFRTRSKASYSSQQSPHISR